MLYCTCQKYLLHYEQNYNVLDIPKTSNFNITPNEAVACQELRFHLSEGFKKKDICNLFIVTNTLQCVLAFWVVTQSLNPDQVLRLSVGLTYQNGHCVLSVLKSQVLPGALVLIYKNRFKVRICNTTWLYRA